MFDTEHRSNNPSQRVTNDAVKSNTVSHYATEPKVANATN